MDVEVTRSNDSSTISIAGSLISVANRDIEVVADAAVTRDF